MRSGWRHILRIWLAKAAEPPSSIHTLFKGYETAIRAAAAHSTAVNRAPRIVLSFRACSKADNTDANSQDEQQEPHSRLLGLPQAINVYSRSLFHAQRKMRREGRDELRKVARAIEGAAALALGRIATGEPLLLALPTFPGEWSHARNSHYSRAHHSGDCCSPMVGLSLTDGSCCASPGASDTVSLSVITD